MSNKKVVSCLHCGLPIADNEVYVSLRTHNILNKPDDIQYFHFQHWVEYFNICVENKSKAVVRGMQSQAVKLLDHPVIANAMQHIKGSEQIKSMLNIPLEEKKILGLNKLIINKLEDKKNGKPKKRKK